MARRYKRGKKGQLAGSYPSPPKPPQPQPAAKSRPTSSEATEQPGNSNVIIPLAEAHIKIHQHKHDTLFEVAAADIAQDLLLRHLHEEGVMDLLAFKGGTALRKMYAGKSGRFSTDLDFSIARPGESREDALALLECAISGAQLGPFSYSVRLRRRRPMVTITTKDGSVADDMKLDVTAPPWLTPAHHGWAPQDVHAFYGGSLPALPCVRLEENMAEKIVRLNRVTTARDIYDLVWVEREHARRSDMEFDHDLVRELVVLKNWVDKFGFSCDGTAWKPAHDANPFIPTNWLRKRPATDINPEDLGRLSKADPLSLLDEMREMYRFLGDLSEAQKQIACLDPRDRRLVLSRIAELPNSQLASVPTY